MQRGGSASRRKRVIIITVSVALVTTMLLLVYCLVDTTNFFVTPVSAYPSEPELQRARPSGPSRTHHLPLTHTQNVYDSPFCRSACWPLYFQCRSFHCLEREKQCVEFCEEAVSNRVRMCTDCGFRSSR